MLLRMKPEYINWSVQGRKTCTTRTKNKGKGQFELVSGSRYKPVKSSVRIEIRLVMAWTPATIKDAQMRLILREEGFQTDNNAWRAFLDLLGLLNGHEIEEDQVMYSHFYRILRV
jgi:hypothetical protein